MSRSGSTVNEISFTRRRSSPGAPASSCSFGDTAFAVGEHEIGHPDVAVQSRTVEALAALIDQLNTGARRQKLSGASGSLPAIGKRREKGKASSVKRGGRKPSAHKSSADRSPRPAARCALAHSSGRSNPDARVEEPDAQQQRSDQINLARHAEQHRKQADRDQRRRVENDLARGRMPSGSTTGSMRIPARA